MKNELRRDYVLEKYSILSRNSGLTFRNYIQQKRFVSDPAYCPFCPQNSAKLPSIIDETLDFQKKWISRVAANIVESVMPDGNPVLSTDNRYFTWSAAYGREEVIIENSNHYDDFGDLPKDLIEVNIKMYIERIKALEASPYISYVALFKNQGFMAGSNSTHSHSQIIAYSIIPKPVIDEIEGIIKFRKINNVCPYCDLQNIERNSFRRILITNTFSAFTPYSSEYPFEVRIYPHRHISKLTQLNDSEISDLAYSLKYIISRINSLNYPSYNVLYITGPVDSSVDFHFYIRIFPRLSKRAGFEMITGTMINPISPEESAKFYRGEQ